ncbi:MAG: AMP-binding protein, partial [bacterium]|nr:AMP-binding protein [bacterium]
GGSSLARGYLNRPQLTAERFTGGPADLQHYFPHERIYRTGDLGQWLYDGTIRFLGRRDFQVKIRGKRVELGEIENCILTHESIKEAVVVARRHRVRRDYADNTEYAGSDTYLCAYVVPTRAASAGGGAKPDLLPEIGLKEYLSKKLPDHMVPFYFIALEKMPLSAHGKVDRKALPALTAGGVEKEKNSIAPADKLETELQSLCALVLGIEPETIGRDSNFFSLGGHSLRATVLVSKIHRQMGIKIPLKQVFETPTIAGMAGYIRNASREDFTVVKPAEKREYYPLSPAQKRLYMLQQMKLGTTVYNMSMALLLEGAVDPVKVAGVFRDLIMRHESLRTSFVLVKEDVVQVIAESFPGNSLNNIKLVDRGSDSPTFKQGNTKESAGDGVEETIKKWVRPFDLSCAPLMRAGLIGLAENKHVLLMDKHHIVSDGTSTDILVRDFMSLYAGEWLPPLEIAYKDYCIWRKNQWERADGELRKQKHYWLSQLNEVPTAAELPLDFVRPEIQGLEGQTLTFAIPGPETAILKQMALQQGVSLFTLLLSILNVWLSKLTGHEDICLGTEIAGRSHEQLQGIVGIFLNTLVLRNFPRSTVTFADFLAEVNEGTLSAFENQDYPFEQLTQRLLGKRNADRNPFFDVLFVWQNMEMDVLKIPGLKLSPYPMEAKSRALTDLSLYGYEKNNEIIMIFEYNTALFRKETVERFMAYFTEIVTVVLKKEKIKLDDIKISHGLTKATGVVPELEDDFGF